MTLLDLRQRLRRHLEEMGDDIQTGRVAADPGGIANKREFCPANTSDPGEDEAAGTVLACFRESQRPDMGECINES